MPPKHSHGPVIAPAYTGRMSMAPDGHFDQLQPFSH